MTELKQLRRDVVYTGKVFDLIVDQVEYPSGNSGIREIAHHPGGAAVVPLLSGDRVLLIRQLRYPFGAHLYEIPAGKLQPGEDPGAAASRELEEETGWTPRELRKLGFIYTTPGFCDEIIHLFVATGLEELDQGHRREEGELSMTLEEFSIVEALAMVRRGAIVDGKTIVGLFRAAEELGIIHTHTPK